MTMPLARFLPLAVLLAFLSACADGRFVGEPRSELGNFRLSHNIVLAGTAVQGPLSRPAQAEDWERVLRDQIAQRMGRYQGDRLYHLAVTVDAYVLAVPGVPLVASPRSALILGVFVWDDELGRPLNENRRQITVLESISGEAVLGSGLTQNAEQQMLVLSRNAARAIEDWLAQHPEWFGGEALPQVAASDRN